MGNLEWVDGPPDGARRRSIDRTGPVLRDYFIARSEAAGLLWVFRERLAPDQQAAARWFLHGLYA